MEIWKKIDGYENYEISNLGRVKSLNYHRTVKEQVLKPFKNNNGYLRVFLYENGKRKKYLIHRLVWEAFNGPIPEGYEVNHLSEDKMQNNLENLNLMSHKENMNFGTRNERTSKTLSKPVIQYDLSGNVIKEYPSVIEVHRQTGYSQGHISSCCNGLLKTAYNYIWKYKEVS